MDDLQTENLQNLRLVVFATVFVVMSLMEFTAPRRMAASGWRRWTTNLSMVVMGGAVGRALVWVSSVIAMPLAAISAAEFAARRGWGVLVAWQDGPTWLKISVAVVVLDFAIYLQHVASHRFELLWRLHRVHHADTDFDVTTALRFHPIEIALSALYKVVWVLALGPSVLAVVLFEIILNGCAMFNHGNVALPAWLDRMLRIFIVTPDMHRVHHSVHRGEHNSNYGFNLSVWDRLFSTYRRQPRDGHATMAIGLAPFRDDAPSRIGWSLLSPLLGVVPEAHDADHQHARDDTPSDR